MGESVSVLILVAIVLLFGLLLALQSMHIWKIEEVVEELRAENKRLRNTFKQFQGRR